MWPRTHTHAPDGARVHRGELMCRSIRSARYRSTTLTRSIRARVWSSHQGIGYSYESIITGNQADAHSPAR